jgi:hypothetical protein
MSLAAPVFERDHGLNRGLALVEAIERVGMPSLGLLVQVDQQDKLTRACWRSPIE